MTIGVIDLREARRILGIKFCPTCGCDTLPLDSTGCCGFCDAQLVKPKVRVKRAKAKTLPTLPVAPSRLPGRCALCDQWLPKHKSKFCSDAHKQAYWIRYSEKGRAWMLRQAAKAAKTKAAA